MQIAGVNQMQINAKAGVTFASGLRSILRQDPNVILVGEIRDQETADIALGAAQTGHLLLSTLHTNDATATITRLFDLGIQPFLIASSLIGIVAQRLVRRPCPACAGAAGRRAPRRSRRSAARRGCRPMAVGRGRGMRPVRAVRHEGTNRHPRGTGRHRRSARPDLGPRGRAR